MAAHDPREANQSAVGERKFRRLLETQAEAIVIVDDGGEIVIVNEQAERMFGYRREELLGQRVELLIPQRLRAGHIGARERYNARPTLARWEPALTWWRGGVTGLSSPSRYR
jgi:PAS domain-containing protein